MKFNALSLGLVAGLAIAAPTPTTNEDAEVAHIAKRASITDVSRTLRTDCHSKSHAYKYVQVGTGKYT